MQFQVMLVVLWPRNKALQPRVVRFQPGTVNVITGASQTGKSAIVPIIDYCLGSGKCSIPTGVIRINTEWFGVVIETAKGQLLLARREPGIQQSTGDMFMMEDPKEVTIPEHVSSKNTNRDFVKAYLDELAGLTSLDFDPNSDSGFKGRPSFRDMAAFNFQPQNIIANPEVLFFKADTFEHREKLRTIFPYVLGVLTPEIMAKRYRLDELRREERDDDDVMRVRKLFEVIAKVTTEQGHKLQTIILDHAAGNVWGDIPGIQLVEEWRGPDKLIPQSWLE
jgi:hypothetical protein